MEIGAYEAKTHLPQLLEKVAKGESIAITKHGVPIVMLVPIEQRKDIAWALQEVKKFRAERQAKGVEPLTAEEIKGMINEGRK